MNIRIKEKWRVLLILAVACVVIAAVYFAIMSYFAFKDMECLRNPTIFPVEDGVWNLTAQELTVPAEELDSYVFYTNSTKIVVTAEIAEGEGKIGLTRVEVPDLWLMENRVTPDSKTVDFNNLSSADRYILSCDDLDGVMVTVSEGREISFGQSFRKVQQSFWNAISDKLYN